MQVKTFKHSGDLGDIIFSLPTVRALGGGILYLDPEGGLNEPLVQNCDYGKQTKLRKKGIDSISSLLLGQDYIKEIRFWNNEPVDINLDEFRKHVKQNANLSDYHLDAFKLDRKEKDISWINKPPPIKVEGRDILLCRTLRYQSNHAQWIGIKNDIALIDRCFFVGHKFEHEAFEWTFDTKVPYIETPTLKDVASYLAGASMYLGNQNVVHAIAEAMKIDTLVEIYRLFPSPLFIRNGAKYF